VCYWALACICCLNKEAKASSARDLLGASEMSRSVQIYLLLLLLILVWGLSWPVGKIGLQYMPPLWYAAGRLWVGTLTMFCVVCVLQRLRLPRREDLKVIFVIGLVQIGIFMALVNGGLYYIESGRAAILVYSTPIWVVPLSIFFFREKGTLLKWMGFVFGTVGILILINPFDMNWHQPHTLLGNGLLISSALCWAIAILCARHMHWPRPPLELIAWQLLVGVIPLTLFLIWTQPHPLIVWDPSLVMSLLYNGILSTAFAYWAVVVIGKALSPVTTSLSLLAVPACGVIFSAWLLHEAITHSVIMAMACIVIGLACVVMKK
jgi:drug/metabolite transporter (DMT)-like permease